LHWLSTTHSKKMYRTGLPHFLMMFGQHTTRLPNPQPLIFVKRTELLRRSLPRLKSVQRRLPRTWQKVADCNRWVKVLGNPIPMSHCCGSFQKMVVFKGKWMIYHQIFEIPYFQTDAQLTFTHEICKTKPWQFMFGFQMFNKNLGKFATLLSISHPFSIHFTQRPRISNTFSPAL
jgi:hypothetical protein